MNINGLSQLGDECSQPLRMLYKNNGSCLVNGYLGDDVKDVSFDDNGHFEFTTHKDFDDSTVDSKEAVLDNSVLIKQTQKGYDFVSFRIYSWDVEQNKYSLLGFDRKDAMDRYYEVLKNNDINLCDDDISVLLQEVGLTFDSVTQVLLNQQTNPLDNMFQTSSSNDEKPFMM